MFKLINPLLLFSLILGLNLKAEVQQCEYNPTYTLKNQNTAKWQRDPSKYVSPYIIYKQIQDNNDLILADLRPKKLFDKYHISSSFSFPFNSLQTKSIFKNKEVVLIGTGKDYKRIERLYEKFQLNGFQNLKILDGGIQYWKSVIDKRVLKEFKVVDLKPLLNEDRSNWLIFDENQTGKVDDLFPNVIHLKGSLSEINLNSYSAITKQSSPLIQNILLVTSQKELSKEINEWQKRFKANIYTIDTKLMDFAVNDYFKQQKIQSYKKRTDGAKFSCL